ncbi:RNA methyltransferase, partial [Candidatus Bathyarchaeota archaeon]
LLYMATYTFNDIINKTVCDLGCGSGILSIGSAYLGAEEVVGVDLDKSAVLTAKRNAEEIGVKVDWIVGDIELIRGKFDTIIQNPPFGVKKHGADLKFLQKALSLAKVVYSIHKSGIKNRRFIEKTVTKDLGGKITTIVETNLVIPHLFNFHKKPKYKVKVDIYRVVKE